MVDQLLRSLHRHADSPGRDEAVDWLREELKDGPKPVKEVEKQAKEEGISNMTLRRAKERPCFESIASDKDHNYWRIALKMVDLRPSSYV